MSAILEAARDKRDKIALARAGAPVGGPMLPEVLRLRLKTIEERLAALEKRRAALDGIPLSPRMARRDLDRLDAIVFCVAQSTGYTPGFLRTACRDNGVSEARFAVCWLAHKLTDFSTTEIGRVVNRAHTTVIHGIRRMNELMATEPAKAAWIAKLETQLNCASVTAGNLSTEP